MQKAVLVLQLQFIETVSPRAAEANPHGPACTENYRDSAVAVGQVVDAPVLLVVPGPLSFQQVLMVQTLQKTVEVPQMQLFCGCGCGMYSAGIAGDTSPCAVFVSLVRRPMMLGIMAGLTQVNWGLEEYMENWVFWEMTSYVSVFGSLVPQFLCQSTEAWFSTSPCIWQSIVRCSVFAFEVQDYGFFGEMTSGMVSAFSAFWVDSGYLFCVSSRRLHGDFSYFLFEGGTLDPLGDSRFFLHTWPIRKWLRMLSFRQWHGFLIDDPVVLVVRVPRVPSWMRQSCSHGCTR